jgi:hypothetical protein
MRTPSRVLVLVAVLSSFSPAEDKQAVAERMQQLFGAARIW